VKAYARALSSLAAAGVLTGECLLVSRKEIPGLALLILGAVLAFLLPTDTVEGAPTTVASPRGRTALKVLILISVAAAARLYRFGEVPPGLWADETEIARIALEGLRGHGAVPWQVIPHLEVAWGYVWVQAFVLKVLGPGVLSVRLLGTLAGILVAPALYRLARRFLPDGIAMLVGLLWGVSFWAVNISRWGHVNTFTPLFLCLVMASVWDGLTTANRRPWLLAGVLFSASLYVYSANRALVFLVLVFVAYWVIAVDRAERRRAGRGLLWFGLGALPLTVPLALCYLSNPALYLGRTRAVSIFDPRYTPDPWRSLVANLGKYAMAFHYRGDLNPRHNLLDRPMLDVVLATLFTLGLARALRLIRRPGNFLALSWFGLFFAAGALTTGAPNAYRIFGIVPGVLLLAGIGFETVVTPWRRGERAFVLAARLVVALLALGVAALDLTAYFGRFAVLPGTWAGFSAGQTRVGLSLARLSGAWTVYTDFLHNSTNAVLSADRPQEELHVTDHLLAPARSTVPTLWMLSPYDLPLASFLREAYPSAQVSVETTPDGEPIFGSVSLPADANRPGLLVERLPDDRPVNRPLENTSVAPLGPETEKSTHAYRVRWYGALRTPATGAYTLKLESANATTLFVNAEPVLGLAVDGSVSVEVWLPQGIVPVRLERVVRGADTLRLTWRPPGGSGFVPIPLEATAPVPIPEGGLLALTWDGARFSGQPVAVRHDPMLLAVRFGTASVAAERWIGDLVVPKAGTYEFYVHSDDGSRLFLDGAAVLSRWILDAGIARASVTLTEGRHAIVIEFVDYGGPRWFEVRWTPPGGSEERLPATALRWRPAQLAAALAPRSEPVIAIDGSDASGSRVAHVRLLAARTSDPAYPPRADSNALGWIPKAGIRMYDRCIGVVAGTALDFPLDGGWSRLTGRLAVDSDTYGKGSAVFRLRGDGKTLLEGRSARTDDPPAPWSVDVSGVKLLTLEVDRGTEEKSDFCDWLDLKLAR
jgi:hypothetical protein